MPSEKRSSGASFPAASRASNRSAASIAPRYHPRCPPGELPMRRMLPALAAALVAMALSFTAAAKDREVSIGLQAAITSIDPHYHNLSPNNAMLQHIFEPLIA